MFELQQKQFKMFHCIIEHQNEPISSRIGLMDYVSLWASFHPTRANKLGSILLLFVSQFSWFLFRIQEAFAGIMIPLDIALFRFETFRVGYPGQRVFMELSSDGFPEDEVHLSGQIYKKVWLLARGERERKQWKPTPPEVMIYKPQSDTSSAQKQPMN